MTHHLLRTIPYSVKQTIYYIYGYLPLRFRYSKLFSDTYHFLEKTQWWDKKKIEEYQTQELIKLIHHAYTNVPYYHKVFDERGLRPKDIKDLRDVVKLPLLTKDDVRTNLKEMIATNIPEKELIYVTTGGTSGKPLSFYITTNTQQMLLAFEWRQWNWIGYHFHDKCVVLRGSVINRWEKGKRSLWEYDRFNNYLMLSTYDMTDYHLPHYVRMIEDFKPKIIQGYPSALSMLAQFIKSKNFSINVSKNIKAISTSSENLFPVQKTLIEEVFNCPIIDKFGNSEQTNIAGQCDRREGYHQLREYSITELIDEKEMPVTQEGETGEIVGTGFINYAVPLIRYKTEDFGVQTQKLCSCGRDALPLLKEIKGRWYQERIVTRNNNYIPITALNSHSDMFDNVKQFQYYQNRKDKLILRIVRKEKYTDTDTKKILAELNNKLKDQVSLEIQFITEIPLTDRGKYKFLIQKLPVSAG